jgi:hypothetical protein
VFLWPDPSVVRLSRVHAVVDFTVGAQESLRDFWGHAHGWAPSEAADLLSRSRLDWQVSLTRSLHRRLEALQVSREPGELIVAWANLGALVEGALQLFLGVWYDSYATDVNRVMRRGALRDPDALMLGELRQFFVARDLLVPEWLDYIAYVQARRNALHAFQDRDIGTRARFIGAVRQYHFFLREIDSGLPYP